MSELYQLLREFQFTFDWHFETHTVESVPEPMLLPVLELSAEGRDDWNDVIPGVTAVVIGSEVRLQAIAHDGILKVVELLPAQILVQSEVVSVVLSETIRSMVQKLRLSSNVRTLQMSEPLSLQYETLRKMRFEFDWTTETERNFEAGTSVELPVFRRDDMMATVLPSSAIRFWKDRSIRLIVMPELLEKADDTAAAAQALLDELSGLRARRVLPLN